MRASRSPAEALRVGSGRRRAIRRARRSGLPTPGEAVTALERARAELAVLAWRMERLRLRVAIAGESP